MPRLGKIRLGVKETSARTGSQYPKATDFLVVPDDIKPYVGDKPRSLDIVFPIEDTSKPVDEQPFFPQWLKAWGAGTGLKCKGDGRVAHRVQEGGGFAEVECDPESCPDFQAKKCQRNANLQFMLPKVPGAGVWQIDTTSFHSILQVNSALELIRSLAGRLSLIPLRLEVTMKEVAPDGKKKLVPTLNLRYDGTAQDLAAIAGRAPSTMFALPPVDDSLPPDDITDPAIVATYSDALAAKEAEEARARQAILASSVDTEEDGVPPTPPAAPSPAQPTPSPSPTIEATDTPPSSEGKLRADIEGFMLRLRLSEAQKAKAREKYPEPEDLWRALRAEVAKRKEASQGGQDRLVG